MGIADIENCRSYCDFDEPLDGCFSHPSVSGIFLEIDILVAIVSDVKISAGSFRRFVFPSPENQIW
jgi:hypothetical protein